MPKNSKNNRVKRFALILITVSFLFSQVTLPVKAASSPLTQTTWVGETGQNITTSTSGQLTLSASSNWYNTSWAYRRKITFDNSAQAENLTNFPVLVKIDSTRINYENTQNSGQDLRFTDSDGTTLLSYEIEKWNESGESFVWVKVPQIDASSNTDYIYMYYGNSTVASGADGEGVWSNDYKGVCQVPNSLNKYSLLAMV